jgi:hypothetical protein
VVAVCGHAAQGGGFCARIFCARIEGCGWTCAQKLLRSDRSELVVEPRLNASQRAKVLELGLVVPERMKLKLPEGRGVQIVATSLMDTQKFPTHAFGELYRKRWGIEEGFKLLKHRQHLEGFSGELPESIEQEIGAKLLLNNIAQAVAHQAKRDVTKADKERWAVSAAYALKQAGPVVVCAFKGVATVLKRSVKALTGVLQKPWSEYVQIDHSHASMPSAAHSACVRLIGKFGLNLMALPIGLAGGDNLYGYVANPGGWIDPLGWCAQALGNNMEAAGINRPANTTPHHIAGDTSAASLRGRQILNKHGIHPDDAANGVFLPNCFNTNASVPGILHNGRHPNVHVDAVNTRLIDADALGVKQAVFNELKSIGQELSQAARNTKWINVL